MIHRTPASPDPTRLALYIALTIACGFLLTWSSLSRADVAVAGVPGADRSAALAQLVRGTSTRADVERLLGRASGTGGSRLPPDWQLRDIWFYELIKIGEMTPEPASPEEKARTIRVDMSQDILLVFFNGDRYDGYLWYTNVGGAEGRVPDNLR